MTDVHDREPDTYAWKSAPAHLKTRRQLRAAGLAPGGHAPVAQTEHKRFGRRQITYLYDSRVAVPKRTASPAQLLAVAKAIREHQARAAERHGIDRADLDRANDPAPGWDHTPESTTHKEENPMSDTTSPGRDDTALQLGIPTGHGQRIAYLLAVVAVNQARDYHDKLDAAVEQAERKGAEAVGRLEVRMLADVEAAEARLTANTADHGPASVEPLADALAFSSGSDIAADRLDHLIDAYRIDWGVRIDAMSLTVDIDPDFDAVTRQRFAEAERVFDRKAAAVDIVSALPLDGTAKAAVEQAIDVWHTGIAPDSQRWLDAEPAARQQLDVDLAAAKVSVADRARVGFVVDFLRGEVGEVDLLTSPVFVDPGEETRSRVPELLDRFARNPKTAKEVGREISVMTKADQERVSAAGKAIAEGKSVDPELWPGYVHRQSIAEDLENYAHDVAELRLDADYLAEGRMSQEERAMLGHKSAASHDETAGRIDRIVQAREKLLDQARNGKGLASIERAHLAAVVTDIDNGRGELPELLFADEHSKADADFMRRSRAADQLSTAAREAISQRIAATNTVDPDSRAADQLDQAVKDVGRTLGTVASGTRAFSIEHKRTDFADKRGRLGQALTQAGVPTPARAEIRDVLDAHARKAGELGRASVARTEQWEAKVAHVAAARDDAAAQRLAAAAGRAKPSEAARQGQAQRACTARIDTSLTAGHAPAGIRQLHSQGQEIGR